MLVCVQYEFLMTSHRRFISFVDAAFPGLDSILVDG